MIGKKVLVSAKLIEILKQQADFEMSRPSNARLKQDWLDQCTTSETSNKYGVVKLDTDHDWVLGFWIWRSGAGGLLPREK